jgi:hypothetical protein
MSVHWAAQYAFYATCTEVAEKRFIVDSPIATGVDVACFTATSVVKVRRVDRHELRHAMDRSDLVTLMCALEQLDGVVSRAAKLPAAEIRVHGYLYGKDEYAHTPKPPHSGSYVSFNVGQVRVREIFQGVFWKDKTAVQVLVDLYLHEKAHVSCFFVNEQHEGHDAQFYAHKCYLKNCLIDAIRANSNVDPFRHIRRHFGVMPSVDDLAVHFPYEGT